MRGGGDGVRPPRSQILKASLRLERRQVQRPRQLFEMSTVDIQSFEMETDLRPLRQYIQALRVEPFQKSGPMTLPVIGPSAAI